MNEKLNIPNHVAIIMDGNGRWASQNGFDRSYGHMMGVESVKDVIDESLVLGVRYLTLYAFSFENWSRPKTEVDGLMELFCSTIISQKDILKKRGVRVLFMGDKDALSLKVCEYIKICEDETSQNLKLTLVVALNYSSRMELTNATKLISRKVLSGELSIDDITESVISKHLYIGSVPDPDLIIRTSGECRLSNFLLWQSSYSEFYFTSVFWPEFKKEEYREAIEVFSKRKRRFGNI